MDQTGQHHTQLVRHLYAASGQAISTDADGGTSDKFPQWNMQETRELLIIRAELDPTFMETKRNKFLWELISSRMTEKGFNRSPEQCKSKWKNLVTRYKGCETMEAAGMSHQFPFYKEMLTIFNARMQRMVWQEAEDGRAASSTKKKAAAAPQFSSNEEDENDDNEVKKGDARKRRKRKMKGTADDHASGSAGDSSSAILSGIKEMMEELMKQHTEMEMQWMEAYEKREEERREREMEWRQTMAALENERMVMDRKWREREEQRKVREEARAEKREALISALFNKLGGQT